MCEQYWHAGSLVQRTMFYANIFHSSNLLNRIQLARQYSLLIASIQSSEVAKPHWTPILKGRLPGQSLHHSSGKPLSINPKYVHEKRTKIFVNYNISKQNDSARCIEWSVLSTADNKLRCKRTHNGPARTAAYDNVRHAAKYDLVRKLIIELLNYTLSQNNKS